MDTGQWFMQWQPEHCGGTQQDSSRTMAHRRTGCPFTVWDTPWFCQLRVAYFE